MYDKGYVTSDHLMTTQAELIAIGLINTDQQQHESSSIMNARRGLTYRHHQRPR